MSHPSKLLRKINQRGSLADMRPKHQGTKVKPTNVTIATSSRDTRSMISSRPVPRFFTSKVCPSRSPLRSLISRAAWMSKRGLSWVICQWNRRLLKPPGMRQRYLPRFTPWRPCNEILQMCFHLISWWLEGRMWLNWEGVWPLKIDTSDSKVCYKWRSNKRISHPV